LWPLSRRASLFPRMSRRASLRASDADREHIAERLRKAAAEGRILTEELEHRLMAAFSARTYGELEPLVADLPREVARRDRRERSLPVPKAAIALMILIGMPMAVAVVIAAAVLLVSMFAMWIVVVAIVMWVFGHRLPVYPRRYAGRRRGPGPQHWHGQQWRGHQARGTAGPGSWL
jgi:hypothetical protein